MTDPLALDPVLSPSEIAGGAPVRCARRSLRLVVRAVEAHVMNGGRVEAVDAMPDEYGSPSCCLSRCTPTAS